jgi:transposase-like protein
MVRRMAGREGISAMALSREAGVAQPTLSRWLRDARSVKGMSQGEPTGEEPTKRRKWTTEEKLRVVLEASGKSEQELGAYLRREGLHAAQLKEWRSAVTAALGTGKSKPKKNSREAKRTRELEKHLLRKEKALAEVAALLTLKNKVQEIWGDEGDSTSTESGT